jgi:hypothetical protein
MPAFPAQPAAAPQIEVEPVKAISSPQPDEQPLQPMVAELEPVAVLNPRDYRDRPATRG